MKCCGCSRSHWNEGHVSRAVTTVPFQAHLQRSHCCAVTLPGRGCAATGPTCQQPPVCAGARQHSKPRPRWWEVLINSRQETTGVKPTPLKLITFYTFLNSAITWIFSPKRSPAVLIEAAPRQGFEVVSVKKLECVLPPGRRSWQPACLARSLLPRLSAPGPVF